MKVLVPLLILVGIPLMLGGRYISSRNGLITRDENVKEMWSTIEVQQVRRADLIHNLISTVRGYAAHEKEIFTAVAEARTALIASPFSPQRRSRAYSAAFSCRHQGLRMRNLVWKVLDILPCSSRCSMQARTHPRPPHMAAL